MKGIHFLLFGLSAGMLLFAFYNPISDMMKEKFNCVSGKKSGLHLDNFDPLPLPNEPKFLINQPTTTSNAFTTTTTTMRTTSAPEKTITFSSTASAKNIPTNQQEFAQIMEALQEERKTVIKRTCERFHSKTMKGCALTHNHGQDNGNLVGPNIFYSITYKYAVCYIQKCGFSSWLGAVLVHDGFKTYEDFRQGKTNGQKNIDFVMRNRELSAITNTSLKAKTWNQSLKIIRVRNPFERIVSAYNDKMTEKYDPFTYIFGPISKQINQKYKPLRHNLEDRLKNDTTASFEDFVRHLLSDAPRDSHWEFYDTFCRPCYADYDYVIKFETIARDLAYLKLKLNITKEDHKKVFTAWHPKTEKEEVKKYFDQIPKQLAVQLYEKYEIDFLMFGYEKPSWLCSEKP